MSIYLKNIKTIIQYNVCQRVTLSSYLFASEISETAGSSSGMLKLLD